MNKHINDIYWLNIAEKVAEASTCATKVGCLIVYHKEIVGLGYNGSIHGANHCNDSNCLLVNNFGIKGSNSDHKSCIRTVHAEVNAALKCKVRGSFKDWLTCYSTHQPCLECTKILLQIGVRTFIYVKSYRDNYRDVFLNALGAKNIINKDNTLLLDI